MRTLAIGSTSIDGITGITQHLWASSTTTGSVTTYTTPLNWTVGYDCSNRLPGFTQTLTNVRGTRTVSTANTNVSYAVDPAGLSECCVSRPAPSCQNPRVPHTLASPVHSDLLIRKSRFIGCVQAVPDRAAAQAVVAGLRSAHPGAAHVCWALLAGGQSAAHDDGEPGGTAGRPMLEVLRRQDLDGVLATVVRYFGGVKLGAGGLVRAYTDAVAQALLAADKVAVHKTVTLCCSVPYALEGWLRRELQAAGATLLDALHGGAVTVTFSVTDAAAPALRRRINDAGQGAVGWSADMAD